MARDALGRLHRGHAPGVVGEVVDPDPAGEPRVGEGLGMDIPQSEKSPV